LNQILTNIWMWSEYQSDRSFCFNGFALKCEETVYIVDPVGISPEGMLTLRELGDRFEIILLNADHEREAEAFIDALSAKLWAPKTDVALLKTQKRVFTYGHEHRFGDDWEAKHLLGMKTPGESVLYSERQGVLLVGDAILADPASGLRLVPKQKLQDTARALKALERLASLDFRSLLCGDGFQLLKGGREALSVFIASNQP
jgi:glyoxylase-like metal-dependent hydrolase (beta-lactamase superfamily II)